MIITPTLPEVEQEASGIAVSLAQQQEAQQSQVQKPGVIGGQTAISSTWTVGARLISRVIDLVTMIMLAHILHPQDFGLVAIAMTVIFIVEAALELPVSQALVRLDVIKPEHYDTAFTLGLIRGLLLTVIVCLISLPFARFYGDPRLVPLVCVLSIAPASRSLISPRLASFAKSFNFVPDFTMEFFGKLAAFAVAISLALLTRSYWAVAAGTLVTPVVSTIISYYVAPYRPRVSLKELPAFSGFLGWITAAQIVGAVNWQTDRLLLGKLTTRSALGLFTAANDTANVPFAALLIPIMKPLLSAFSVLRQDPRRLARSYQTSACAIITLALPVLIGESMIAEPFVRLVLGPKWLGSALYLRWLALSLIPTLFAVPLGPLVMAFGKTNIFFKRNLFEISIKLPLVVLGALRFGFMGVVLARAISETLTVCFCMVIVRRLLGISIYDQLFTAWRSVVSVAAMAGALFLVLPHLTHATAPVPLAFGTLAAMMIAAAVYCATLFALWFAVGGPHGIEAITANKFKSVFNFRNKSAVEVAS